MFQISVKSFLYKIVFEKLTQQAGSIQGRIISCELAIKEFIYSNCNVKLPHLFVGCYQFPLDEELIDPFYIIITSL